MFMMTGLNSFTQDFTRNVGKGSRMHDFEADDRISALVCSRVRGEKLLKTGISAVFSSLGVLSGVNESTILSILVLK